VAITFFTDAMFHSNMNFSGTADLMVKLSSLKSLSLLFSTFDTSVIVTSVFTVYFNICSDTLGIADYSQLLKAFVEEAVNRD